MSRVLETGGGCRERRRWRHHLRARGHRRRWGHAHQPGIESLVHLRAGDEEQRHQGRIHWCGDHDGAACSGVVPAGLVVVTTIAAIR
uniref:Predicted protein n=1 Tax=Hordeum vulgare subsp. vulgare TaxID=112509 RepID=F2DAX0_HORVV|nr:predicted protein [Hordeum vulgare subsp. vulgare]